MKRLLTTLAILLVVLVAGMTALVLLVNPNDFRAYMIKKVEQRSGYHLTLEGDLRWHAWPQLSILVGRMTLTAPGAQTPVVSADNMRLDVKLLPLLSHQLYVKQVMLKNAVIRLTPDSQAQRQPDAPIAPGDNPADDTAESLWKYAIDDLQVVDSLLIWQRANNEQINVRDINLRLQQNDQHQAQITLSSRVNRDQRDLSFSLAADLDLQQYPRQIGATVSQFNYQLEGAGLSASGIKGEGKGQAVYQLSPPLIALNQLMLSANDNQLTGDVNVQLGQEPVYVLDLTASRLNLDTLFASQVKTSGEERAGQPTSAAPVIANQAESPWQNLQVLRAFNAQLSLKAEQTTFRGINISQLAVQADNQQGLLTLKTLSGKIADGDFTLRGLLNVQGDKSLIRLQPVLRQIELGDVLNAFNMPLALTGAFSMQGDLNTEGADTTSFENSWKGNAELSMQNARLHGLNIQQIVQQTVARNDNSVRGEESYPRYTEVKQINTKANLSKGVITLSQLTAESSRLSIDGGGTLDISREQCDMTLNVRVTAGWQGNNELIAQLIKIPLPLRVYGPWKQLNYQLQLDQLLRKTLQDRAKDALNKWVDKNKASQQGQDLKTLLDKL